MEPEIWKPIPTCGGLYEASSLGRIRSVERYVTHCCGGKSLKRSRVLSPWKNNMGYLSVELHREGRRYKWLVHRLVALAFFPGFDGDEVNHLDFNPQNNCVSNLELSNRRDNQMYSVRAGHCTAATNPRRQKKMTPESVAALRSARETGATYQQLAEQFGIHRVTASQICRHTSWV